jgi:type VI secretion system secreted protein VgrG
MVGNLLSGTSIAMQTGATLNGRLLAQAAVTLDQNTVTGPSCAPAATSTGTTTGLPNTGYAPVAKKTPWLGIGAVALTAAPALYLLRRKYS